MQKIKQRLLPVLVSTLTVLSAMAVIAVSQPASAAEGSFEVLIDHDGDPNTPAARQFAGETRYHTATQAAEQYFQTHGVKIELVFDELGDYVLDEQGEYQRAVAQTVIVASGESLIDAAAAAGLASRLKAPVLLTPLDRLHESIPALINKWGITSVVVLGGTAAVSESVIDELRAIPSIADNIERYAGTSRFDTAAKVAMENFPYEHPYCSKFRNENYFGSAAVLVAGDAEPYSDVIVAGPLAHAMNLPVLLASSNGLPAETTAALDTLDIKHVVIIGGQYSLGDLDKLEMDLLASGRSKVTRLEGENPFATAIRVRETMRDCLRPEFGGLFSEETVALISETASADGISATPLLGRGFIGESSSKTTFALLVSSEELPSETREYLETIAVPLAITVIGGENAVPTAVAQAAVDAANTLPTPVVVNGLPSRSHTFGFGEGPRTTELVVEPADAVISVTTSGGAEDLFTFEITGTGANRTLSVTPLASYTEDLPFPTRFNDDWASDITFTATAANRATLTYTIEFSISESDCRFTEGLDSPGLSSPSHGSPSHATAGLLSPNLAASFSSIFKSC